MKYFFPQIKAIFLIIVGTMAILYSSCRKDNVIDNNPSITLNFSADSVIFDTVFTSLGSATKQLRVYNNSKSKIQISSISIGMGDQSAYRINVDGESGFIFSDIELAAGDSLYIFARVTIDPQNLNNPYVIEDEIEFITNGNNQTIKLVAWGQDANYIIADTYIEGLPPFKIIADSLETVYWRKDKPYVIYGFAVIDSYGKLVIEEGSKVYFHNNSGLWAYIDGVLNVLGTIEEPVYFQGDRLEDFYDDVPGQWDRIWLMEGRQGFDHIIENAKIKNGFIGIQVESFSRVTENRLKLNNVTVENMDGIGILSRIFSVEATNTVVSNCGAYNLALTGGGYYSFTQSTIAAYWPYSVRNTPSVFINNYLLDSIDNPIPIPINCNFDNSIIYGSNESEFETDMTGDTDSLYFFRNSLIKTTHDITNPDIYINVLNNENPLFESIENNDYRIDTLSPAIGKADLAIASTVPFDIIGNSRLPVPDVGAYQFIPGQNADDKSMGPANHLLPIKKLTSIIKKGNYPKLK